MLETLCWPPPPGTSVSVVQDTCGGHAVTNAQAAEDRLDVELHGVQADEEPHPDLLVGAALGEELKDLHLALAERYQGIIALRRDSALPPGGQDGASVRHLGDARGELVDIAISEKHAAHAVVGYQAEEFRRQRIGQDHNLKVRKARAYGPDLIHRLVRVIAE